MPGMTFAHGLQLWNLIREFVSVLAWPLTILVLALIFRESLRTLIKNIRRAELPWGGGTVEFQQEAIRLNAEANQPDPDRKGHVRQTPRTSNVDYNAIQFARGFSVTSSGLDLNYFRSLVSVDPNLSLAALRMEIETIVRNLAIGSDLKPPNSQGAGRGLRELFDYDIITRQQYDTAMGILNFCNRAIHGQNVNALTALAIIEAAEPLMNDYKDWLYSEFSENSSGDESSSGAL